MKKAGKTRLEPSWGIECEKKFVDGMGTYSERRFIDDNTGTIRTDRGWLTMYIKSHENSPHAHHKVGVTYAKNKLELMDKGGSYGS
jgi:hypothetical protein